MEFSSSACGPSPRRGISSSPYFPQPQLDYTSTAFPKTFADLIDWSEFTFISSDIQQIFSRLFGYFITEIDIRAIDEIQKPLDDNDKRRWSDSLEDEVGWGPFIHAVMMDLAAYGNCFWSVVPKHRRFLICQHCGKRTELQHFANTSGTDFAYRKHRFVGRCQSPTCRSAHRGTEVMQVVDLMLPQVSNLVFHRWPIREIQLYYYQATGETAVYRDIPRSYKREVENGDLKTLADADLNVLKAIEKNRLFKFHPDYVMHVKEYSLSGLENRGWGIPRSIFLMRPQWTLQMLRKSIQAVAMDFVVPTRVVSPANKNIDLGNGIQTNPGIDVPHHDFARTFAAMRKKQRRDPTEMFAFPYPIEYQLFGGEANQIVPRELLELTRKDMLDAGGFPIELYDMTLNVNVAPVGLRLFESVNRSIPWMLNRCLKFAVDRISEYTMMEPVKARHERVTIADNLEVLAAKLQLGTAGEISRRTAYKPLGIDPIAEERIKNEEMLDSQQNQIELQKRLSKQDQADMLLRQPAQQAADPAAQGAAPGQPAQGAPQGDPAAVGPPVSSAPMLPSEGYLPPTDLAALDSAAQAMAETLSTMPNMQRQQELDILRNKHPVFHGVVMNWLPKVRYQQSQMARQQMMGM